MWDAVPIEVFVDESKRDDYMLCAAVVASMDVDAARRAMRAMKPPNRGRVHMQSEGAAQKRALLNQFVAAAPVGCAQMWIARLGGRRERDVRDACFRALVAHVVEMGARRIVVESCSQDAQDERVIGASLAAVQALGAVRYDVVRAHEEPLLWAADLVAWAYGAGGAARRAVAELVTVHRIP